jgi:S-adenosylmethionine synthetase
MSDRTLFTSESVTEGHPDKIADQVSDGVLDAILAQDPMARVACETLLTTGLCVVAGEITTSAIVDVSAIARKTIVDIGYDDGAKGFDGNNCAVLVSLDQQSPDIAGGVDVALEKRSGSGGEDELNALGAGDQGMMFGYACNDNDDFMPLPIWLAHRLSMRLSQVRRSGQVPYLRPDGKTQVTVAYEEGRPVAIDTVLVSTQHEDGYDHDTIHHDVLEHVIRPMLPSDLDTSSMRVFVNPSGKFVLGGPHADTGLTGRKIIVDTYGGMARHGGAPSRGRTRARSTARPPTPRAGWPSTSLPRAQPSAVRFRWPTPSASRDRCRFLSTPSAPNASIAKRSPRPWTPSSTYVPPPSFATSIFAVPFISARRRTVTLDAPIKASPGSRRLGSMTCAGNCR